MVSRVKLNNSDIYATNADDSSKTVTRVNNGIVSAVTILILPYV